jgi:hypothetical protein
MQVRGDAFLARIFDDEDTFKRMDFTLAEVSSSSPWVMEARKQVAKRQGQPDAQTLVKQAEAARLTAPPAKAASAAAAPPKVGGLVLGGDC